MVPEYVDLITAIIPWAPKTLGKVKIFSIVLNPDSDSVLEAGKLTESLVGDTLGENSTMGFITANEAPPLRSSTMILPGYTPEQEAEIQQTQSNTPLYLTGLLATSIVVPPVTINYVTQ
jgi:hypothetical protein